jgi:hypothetical protein
MVHFCEVENINPLGSGCGKYSYFAVAGFNVTSGAFIFASFAYEAYLTGIKAAGTGLVVSYSR